MFGIFYNIKFPTILISLLSAYSATSIVKAKAVKIHVLLDYLEFRLKILWSSVTV